MLGLTGCGGGDNDETDINEPLANVPPSFIVGSVSTPEDTPLTVGLTAIASDGDSRSLTFNIDQCPQNIVCSLEEESLVLTPVTDYFGQENLIEMTVTDDAGASVSGSFNLIVTAVNDAPVLSLSDQVTVEDKPLSIQLASIAADIDNDPLAFQVESCPQSVECVIQDGMLTMTPAANYFGDTNTISVSVSDGQQVGVTDTFNLVVSPVNDVPQWQSLPSLEMEISKSVSLDLGGYVSDIEQDQLDLSISACPAGIECRIENNELILDGATEVGTELRVAVTATDGSDTAEAELLLNVNRLSVSSLSGVAFYPEFNGLTGNDNITLSFTSDQTIEAVLVNGQSESLPDEGKSWQKNYSLVMGENLFDIEIRTHDKSWQFERVLKYSGPMHHGSSHGKFDGNRSFIVSDYRRGGLLSFDLETLETKFFDDALLPELAGNMDAFLVHGDTILASVYDYDLGKYTLVEINTADSTSSVIHSLESGSKYDLMTLSDDGNQLYFFNNNYIYDDGNDTWIEVQEFYRLDLAAQELTLLADTAKVPDDEEINSLRHMIYDPSENRLLVIDDNYRASELRLLSMHLDGANSGRLQEVSLSADGHCIAGFSDLRISYVSPNRDGKWFWANGIDRGNVYQFDIASACITQVHSVPDKLQRNRHSLQGVDINTATGEMILGFYPGPILFNPAIDNYKGLEIDGFAGPSWEVGEPAFMAFDAGTDTIYYTDQKFLLSLNFASGEFRQLHELTDDAYGVELDDINKVLYIADEGDELGKFDLQSQTYTQLLSSTDGYDFEHLTLGDNGILYFEHRDVIMSYDTQSGLVTELSPDDAEHTLYRENHMVFDSVNQRLIIDTEDKVTDATYFIAIDVQTGERTSLNPDNTVEYYISDYLDITDDGAGLIFYEPSKDSLVEFDFATGAMTELLSESEELNKISDVTDIIKVGEHRYLLGDDDLGGFWLVNSITNERILLR
nr:Ig-like domain-containing protein [Shewanella submarina]